MNNIVPFFNYPELFNRHEASLIEVFKDVGKRGAFIMQKDLEEFEQTLADYTGSKFAVGVANATDGLQMGMMAGGLKNGGEVIISSHTMIATASAIKFCGAKPVPVDIKKSDGSNVLQVDDMELAEVTICEKGVNQGAHFELLKGDKASGSCVDGSCLTNHSEPAPSVQTEYIAISKEDINHIDMFYFSSFDESWKVEAEGDVGAYWGLWDKDEVIKF